MKKFAAFLMILSVSVFTLGCGGDKTKTDDGGTQKTGKTDDGGEMGKTKTDDGGTQKTGKTDDGGMPE